MLPILIFFCLVLGLCVGSFLNVVIHRLPLHKSIVAPASACPHCSIPIKPYDNIPVFSYLFLRGKCRQCKAKISLRYPLVEILTAIGFYLFFYRHGYMVSVVFIRDIIFYCVGLAIIFIDIEHFIIPDVLSIPLIVIGLVSSFLIDEPGWVSALFGAVFGFLLFYGISFSYYKLKKEIGLGGGDVKYIAAIGAFVGIWGLLFVLFFSSLVALISFMVLSVVGYRPKVPKEATEQISERAMPYAPFLTIATFIYLLVGDWFLEVYLGMW